ncbi:hypothetical protein ACC761_14635 [Rhizobium ruizarguesonis]|uniref:Transcriptional regulator n=1 Tax=Rhizobium ruizarguesonis TaxID=2081791 RepID=A0AB38HRC4_9HYPH|nr:hypothetical protein [Rhizobium ruizarguesonis]TBC01438.1 hypothetical protein ELH40_38300 [Rhizobium ruizarguesonis]
MASPWKLLARLVSPRRQQRQDHSPTDDAKPDVLAIAKPTDAAAGSGLNTADPPVDEKSVPHDQSEEVSAADLEGARPLEIADPALSDDADITAHDAPKPLQAGKGAMRKRSRRGKNAETVEVVPPPSLGDPIVSDDAISLDEEIRLLRDRLRRKLQLQNAQLKKMLQRFER